MPTTYEKSITAFAIQLFDRTVKQKLIYNKLNQSKLIMMMKVSSCVLGAVKIKVPCIGQI